MIKLTNRKLEILQTIADKIDSDKYCHYDVVQFYDGVPVIPDDYFDEDYYLEGDNREDGIYLIPDEARWIGDIGEFMGDTFEQAKVNIAEFIGDKT